MLGPSRKRKVRACWPGGHVWVIVNKKEYPTYYDTFIIRNFFVNIAHFYFYFRKIKVTHSATNNSGVGRNKYHPVLKL